jgi:rSAM/selenodomain-associated transferase 2
VVDAAANLRLSVIVPALNEAAGIADTLQPLQGLRRRGHEVIVVDGASRDATVRVSAPLADRVLDSRRGRAAQMNTGAQAATGTVLWFLHADTRPPADADRIILPALQAGGGIWGHFDVAMGGPWPLRVVAWLMNRRARISRIATGDQGMFVTRQAFRQVGGFAALPLMEDIVLSRDLRRLGRPLVLRPALQTSTRRWQKHGIVSTILSMWLLRFAFFLGVSPERLAAHYPGHDT